MKKKIKFYELVMSGEYHVEINLGLILILSNIYPDYECQFSGEKVHVKNLAKRDITKKVRYRSYTYFPEAILKTILLRDFFGCIYSFGAFIKSKKADILFFANVLPMTHWFVFVLNLFFKRDCYIGLHGQVEAYVPNNNLRFTKYYFKTQLPIFRIDKKNRYIIFGDVIYRQIKNIFGSKVKCIVVDHPYLFDNKCSIIPQLPLKIGQIGVGDYGKGTQYIFELAKLLEPYIRDSKLEVSIVGKLNHNLRHLDNCLVKWNTEPLSQIEFNNQVEQLHFSLFFRDKNTGSVVASGSFMDAVKYLKPYLSFVNPYIEFYNSKFPSSGDLFNDVEEMAKFITYVIDNYENFDYGYKINSLKKLQDSLSIDSITNNFKNQIK